MVSSTLKKVYKFHTWETKDCYNNGNDRFVVAEDDELAILKMRDFVDDVRRNYGIELSFSRNPIVYIEDLIV